MLLLKLLRILLASEAHKNAGIFVCALWGNSGGLIGGEDFTKQGLLCVRVHESSLSLIFLILSSVSIHDACIKAGGYRAIGDCESSSTANIFSRLIWRYNTDWGNSCQFTVWALHWDLHERVWADGALRSRVTKVTNGVLRERSSNRHSLLWVIVYHSGKHDYGEYCKKCGKSKHEVLIGHHAKPILIKWVRLFTCTRHCDLRFLLFDMMNGNILLWHSLMIFFITFILILLWK